MIFKLIRSRMRVCVNTDIDECKERKACQCSECSCKDTWGSYECTCSGDLLYIRDHDTCISEFRNPCSVVIQIMYAFENAFSGSCVELSYLLNGR